jgi:simple sugar transport system permease protein
MPSAADPRDRSLRAPRLPLLRRFFALEGTAIIVVLALLIALFMVSAPRTFLGYRIYMAFLASVPPPLVLALGLTFVVIAGEMDLSFPSIVAFASYVFSALFKFHDLTFVAVAVTLVLSAGLGLINGIIVTELGIPSMIATLATLFFWGGLVTIISNGLTIAIPAVEDTLVHAVFAGRIGAFPVQSLWALATAGLLWFVLNRHPFGENVLFLGDNAKVAHVVGIPVVATRVKVFTLMGLLSGFAGILLTLETTTYFPNQGMGYLLIVVASVFIGGTSIFGGAGTIVGTVAGSLIVAMIEAGLVASGVQGFWTRFFIGVVFVASVTLNAALEDPDRVPILRRLRLRLRRAPRRRAGLNVAARERETT